MQTVKATRKDKIAVITAREDRINNNTAERNIVYDTLQKCTKSDN